MRSSKRDIMTCHESILEEWQDENQNGDVDLHQETSHTGKTSHRKVPQPSSLFNSSLFYNKSDRVRNNLVTTEDNIMTIKKRRQFQILL